MNEKETVKMLSKIKPMPTKLWQDKVLHDFDMLVTSKQNLRNSFVSIFYFFKLPNMNTKTKGIAILLTGVVLLTSGTGAVYAADTSNPGDIFYGLDKAIENVQRNITSNSVKSSEFELKIMDERLLELEEVGDWEDSESVSLCLTEVEAQRLRVQERLKEMDQLRIENKLENEDQQKVLQKLQEKVLLHDRTMNEVEDTLETKGNVTNSESLREIKENYTEDTQNQIRNFETETGIEIEESEDDQNDDSNDHTQSNQEQEQERERKQEREIEQDEEQEREQNQNQYQYQNGN